jgi:hypothetical protein
MAVKKQHRGQSSALGRVIFQFLCYEIRTWVLRNQELDETRDNLRGPGQTPAGFTAVLDSGADRAWQGREFPG